MFFKNFVILSFKYDNVSPDNFEIKLIGNFSVVPYVYNCLKVPKREIFDRSDFPDFYTIKPSWV